MTFPFSSGQHLTLSDEIALQQWVIFVKINLCISFFLVCEKTQKNHCEKDSESQSLPFSSVLVVTKAVTDNFQVYLYDEMHGNSTRQSGNK